MKTWALVHFDLSSYLSLQQKEKIDFEAKEWTEFITQCSTLKCIEVLKVSEHPLRKLEVSSDGEYCAFISPKYLTVAHLSSRNFHR